MITIGMPVYNEVDLLDVTGPYEIFSWMREPDKAEVWLIAEEAGEIATRDGFTFKATKRFDEVAALDVLWVPGGNPGALRRLMTDPARTYLDFLVRQAETARYVCSVCEGALLLAAAGLLDGYEATTHWQFIACLKRFPKIKVAPGTPRFIVDRNRVTGGGISSGLDESLKLVELLSNRQAAEAVQRITQYFPDPPVHSEIEPAPNCPFPF
jgi:cyclohexyl-isocyanide hydratase